MRKVALLGIVVTLTFCGLISGLSIGPAWAELIPALKTVPEGLPVDVKERLSQRRQELEKKLQEFLAAAKKFNETPAEQQSKAEFDALQNRRSQYIKAAKGFNQEVNSAAADQRVKPVTQKTHLAIAKWSGNWTEKEKALILNGLGKFKDKELRDWISANMEFHRAKPDGVSPISASGEALRVKDDFFSKTPAEQENLFAFEAGKVFWNTAKGEQTLMNWWNSYYGKYSSVIAKTKTAKYQGADLSNVYDPPFEHYSGFGYVFRAVVLPLDKPKGQSEQQEWNNAISEFKMQIKKLLPDKQ